MFNLLNPSSHVDTYLPTVMWKFPATLLTYRCPCILQALREVELSSLWRKGATQHRGNHFITIYGRWNTCVYVCSYLFHHISTPNRKYPVPLRLSKRRSFYCSLEEYVLERVLHSQTLLDVQKCPEGQRQKH